MQVSINQEQVSIDGGKVVVTSPAPGEYNVKANGFANIETDTGVAAPQSEYVVQEITRDPHYYSGGNNYLSLEDSVERAYDKVVDTYYDYTDDVVSNYEDFGSDDDIENAIRDIIKDPDTEGRRSVYKLAGGIVKGYKEGMYRGVPFSTVFEGITRGKIVPKVDTLQMATDWSNAFNSTYGGR